MVLFLIRRPIAVLMVFSVLLIFGFLSLRLIPVSLLPDIDIPRIVIKVNYPNQSAEAIEQNVIDPIRNNLALLRNLEDIESTSSNHLGTLILTYDYGTRMDLAYIEVNESLDRLSSALPRDLPRPQVVRINTSDIPIARIQVIPKDTNTYLQISALTEKVIKRRIEQIEGVSMIDLSGREDNSITVTPNKQKLSSLGITEEELIISVQNANSQIGSMSVRNGQYRYFVKVASAVRVIEDVQNIMIRISDNSTLSLKDVARVELGAGEVVGYHYYNGKKGLVITVHKQSSARMNELVPRIKEALSTFESDYPEIDFAITQDQAFVLDAGISNLNQDLIFGGMLCVVLLFMFLGNAASPLLMSISIPASLIISCIFFYLFNLSFNIISLSGLALGIGMLIDNSIVVLDSITRKRRGGMSMDESCVSGTNEVIAPVISQVLTTVAVYAPLVYLSSFAGSLIFDQAIALTISLGVSLFIAFCLNPVLYKIFLKRSPEKLKEDTIFYKWILRGYHKMINSVFKRKRMYLIFTIALMPIGIIIGIYMPKQYLPPVEQTESLLTIDWNESLDLSQNRTRVFRLMDELKGSYQEWEADFGLKQFILDQGNSTIQTSEIYFKCENEALKEQLDSKINHWFRSNFRGAEWNVRPASNAFSQLFEDVSPFYEVRFKPNTNNELSYNSLNEIIDTVRTSIPFDKGSGFVNEENISLTIDNQKMQLYHIDYLELTQELKRLFGNFVISEIHQFGENQIIYYKDPDVDIRSKLQNSILGSTGVSYPLNAVVTYRYQNSPKYITADKTGVYKALRLNESSLDRIPDLQDSILAVSARNDLGVTFIGKYFTNKKLQSDMFIIFLISILLLYVILAMQFENMIHPLLVMLTMPLGITGAMICLFFAGDSLDIMGAIGFIVVLGIVVDDPILKVETLNRLIREYRSRGEEGDEMVMKAIHEAGDICLKPLLMTSLTTSLALIPILFTTGLGSDLQKPLVWVIVGGLSIGTFFTLWFVPLAYWFITKTNGDK